MNPKGCRVFGKDHAQNKELVRDDYSLKTQPAPRRYRHEKSVGVKHRHGLRMSLKWQSSRLITGRRIEKDGQQRSMPTLFRLLMTLGIIAGLVYSAMFALVTYVEPKKGEITVRVPVEKLNKQQ
jgi:hypothetical protein